jgi:hypothetical protein
MLGAPLGLVVLLLVQADTAPVEVEETVPRFEPLRFDFGARAELRSGQPEGNPTANLTDLEIDPMLAVRVPFRAGSLTLSYEPRLFLVVREYPPQEARKASYLNRARLILDTTPGQRWRFYVEGRFALGDNDFLPLSTVTTPVPGTGAPPVTPGTTPTAPTPAPGPTSLPNTRFLPIIELDASAGFIYSLSPRSGWRLSAGYLYAGGANADVRTTLPLQKGPHASTGLDWSASRVDTLLFSLDASNLRFSSGPQSTIATLSMTWTRAWGRSLGTDLNLGVGGVHATAPPVNGVAGGGNSVYPVGSVGLRYVWASRFVTWSNRVTFLATPTPDQLSGAVNQRLGAGLQSSFSPVKPVVFDVTGTASRSLGVVQRDIRVEGKATYLLGPQLGISLGGRVAWLEGSTLLGAQGFGWLAFLSVGSTGGTTLFGDSK